MDYKIYIYVICIFLSAYAISGINFNNVFRKNKVIEARLLVLLLSLALGYLVGSLVISFVS
jgi:uncharacterized integral membrane protein (TIGR02327 family)